MRILRKADEGDRWETLMPQKFENERELQDLLKKSSSDLIPLDVSTGDTDAVYADELPTRAGPIDLLGIGTSGSVSVMECKLARNPQSRREVVGQVLDYAAWLWESSMADVADAFRQRRGIDPFRLLAERASARGDEYDEEACRAALSRALDVGDFRLLIAVDQFTPELRRIIQYVNQRSGSGGGVRIVALAFPRFSDDSAEILVPEAYGNELPEEREPTNPTETEQLHTEFWTEFRAHLEAQGLGIVMGAPPRRSLVKSLADASGCEFHAWNLKPHRKSGVSIWGSDADREAIIRFVEFVRNDPDRVTVQLEEAIDAVTEGVETGKRDGRDYVSVEWATDFTDRSAWPTLRHQMTAALRTLQSLYPSQS